MQCPKKAFPSYSWKSQPHFKKEFIVGIWNLLLCWDLSLHICSLWKTISLQIYTKANKNCHFHASFPPLGSWWLFPSWSSRIIQTNISVLPIHKEELSETITGDSVCSSTIKISILNELPFEFKCQTCHHDKTCYRDTFGQPQEKKWVKNHSKFHTLLVTFD